HKTKGIVLRTIKYGETSLVVTVFTEKFGVQTYMVNGIRTAKKSGAKAAMYQPAALLEMEVYHNELKGMQRIKESNWAVLYKNILSDVIKNSIALYMVELLYKTLKQPEQNADLFYFCEDALQELDVAPNNIAANFALYFSLHLTHFFGFKISNLHSKALNETLLFVDLLEGCFTYQQPAHPNFISGENALITSELLKIMQPHELSQVKLNHIKRRELLLKYQDYYALHIADFGLMKTLTVLNEVLG
ncbi:MAG: DNA repair protein RecO, partial [Ferruginibacter sp.]